MANYPNYQKWLDVLSQRDAGTLLVCLSALIAISLLWNIRYLAPRFLPIARTIAVAGYFGTFALAILLIKAS